MTTLTPQECEALRTNPEAFLNTARGRLLLAKRNAGEQVACPCDTPTDEEYFATGDPKTIEWMLARLEARRKWDLGKIESTSGGNVRAYSCSPSGCSSCQ